MASDKEVKKKFKIVASENPDKYYATSYLKNKGFFRKKCKSTGIYFWTLDNKREVCGDAGAGDGFTFLNKKIASKSMDYVQMWKAFSDFFEKRGYTPIHRYPVVARWRDDMDFVIASISDFQPYVVSGEVEPPANPLVVPQICIRFNDVDNVGITMSHNTSFVMIGQHAFVTKDEWNQEKYFADLVDWFVEGMGVPLKELIFHEDAWAGGGNFGPCMEIFSGGLELANQVYMLYEQSPNGDKELTNKVLDMGMGHERITWFSQAKGTMYDATFPTVVKKLIKKTGIMYDEDFLKKYLPYGAFLNMDEYDDMDEAWSSVSKKMGMNVQDLKEKLLPLSHLYSIAEHSRTLLIAISDGALPSNVKGGYNLRVILRRALQFIEQNEWDVDLGDVCEWHAEYLKPLFPELSENILHVRKILGVEKQKYVESKQRNQKIIDKVISREISVEKLLELYDSHGISPEEIMRQAKSKGVKVKFPDNFYALLAERHDSVEQKTKTEKKEKFDLKDVIPTNALYYDHYDLVDFHAFVVKVFDLNNEQIIVLDETAFYPTSGGQIHDLGTINGFEVIEVFKQGNIILHKVKGSKFKQGEKVHCKIDFERRMQLAQHHTATHLLTGSARRVLGDHVWQAGAAKTMEKSRLDITHYEQLSDVEIKKIESLANDIVQENRPVYKSFMKRNLAEAQYGIRIYQGGAVPGNNLRIVNVRDFDVEACGGTHLDVTGDVGRIKILKTSKIQDGVLRIEFVAGAAAEKEFEKERAIIKESIKILGCTEKQIPGRAQELFEKWKNSKKGKPNDKELKSNAEYDGDIIEKTAEILKTQPEHIVKTLKRFKEEL